MFNDSDSTTDNQGLSEYYMTLCCVYLIKIALMLAKWLLFMACESSEHFDFGCIASCN